MAEAKKKTTNTKSTTKKGTSNSVKKNTTKSTAKKSTTKSTTAKKTTTKKASTNKITKKSTTPKKTKKVNVVEEEKVVITNITQINEPIKEEVKEDLIKQVEIVSEDTYKEKYAETQPLVTVNLEAFKKQEEEANKDIQVVKTAPLENYLEDKTPKKEVKNDKEHKVVDKGLIVILVGMFVLVLITFITSITNLNYSFTNVLVGVSLAIEAIGVILILINLSKKG